MRSATLTGYVLGTTAAAAAALFALPAGGFDRPTTLALTLGLAILAGVRPVRFAQGSELTATHPVILCALGGLGPLPAVVTAVAGVGASMVGRGRMPRPIRLVFNLSAVVLATSAAYGAFSLAGGTPGAHLSTLLGPLFAATTVYFLVNTGLVTLALVFERHRGFLKTWKDSFRWTAASYFTGLPAAAALLLALEYVGPWGVAMGVPPIWLMAGFYRAHRERLREKQQRIDDVERLNSDLNQKVAELQEALEHVNRLQGLLPICMHCKNVRDDHDAWHRIEVYITEHTELRFTHSLCRDCRHEHYSDIPAKPVETT